MKRTARLAVCLLLLLAILAQLSGCGSLGGLIDSIKNGSGSTEMNISGAYVEIPYSEGVRAVVETEAADTLSRYIIARAYLEMLTGFDVSDEAGFDADAYMALFHQTVEAFDVANILSNELEYNASALEEMMNEGYTGLSGSVTYQEYEPETSAPSLRRTSANPFILQASAAEESEALRWAKDLTEAYDKAPAGRGLRTLAEQMGTDAKHAYAMLKQAQAIIEGDAYGAEADAANRAYKIAVATKAAASTAGFVVSVVATGGATGVAAAIGTAGAAVNGANAILDVGTAGTIIYTNGEGNDYTTMFEQTSKDFSHVSFIVGVLGAGAGVNDARTAETAANIINSALFFFGNAEYIADNFSDMTAMTVQPGSGGLKICMEKGNFEKTTEGLKTAGQMLLNVGFPAGLAAEAVGEAAKNIDIQNIAAAADTASGPAASNEPSAPEAPTNAPAPTGSPADPAQPDEPSGEPAGNQGGTEAESGGFTGDPEKVAQEWTGPKEKEDDFDIEAYIDKLREVLYELAGLIPIEEDEDEGEEEIPLLAEFVSGTYTLSGTAYATGSWTFGGTAKEKEITLTVTVDALSETSLSLHFDTHDHVVEYNPETGKTETFQVEYLTASMTFCADGENIIATYDYEYSTEYGGYTVSLSGGRE